MSKISSKNDNQIMLKNLKSFDSSSQNNSAHISYLSDQKMNPLIINDNEAQNEFMPNSLSKYYSSFSLNGKNKLFSSLMNSKNNKNKELSLLYFINTFNKSFSSESTEKNKIILDLPKISKNLFSKKSHGRHKSSNNLDCLTFQKDLHLKKFGGDVVNNFISSIYQKQYSCTNLNNLNISPKKGIKNKGFIKSGNKLNTYAISISPFSNEDTKFEKMFHSNDSSLNLNNAFNLDNKETKDSGEMMEINKNFSSYLLMNNPMNNECSKDKSKN